MPTSQPDPHTTSSLMRVRLRNLFACLPPGMELATAAVYERLGIEPRSHKDRVYNALQYLWQNGVLQRRMVLGKARWRLAGQVSNGVHGIKEKLA